jgi:hypothetical protein
MPYSLRTFECGGCGGPARRRAAASATVFCVPCAIARSVEQQLQLHRHEGPFYDRWAWRNRLAVRRRKNRPEGYLPSRGNVTATQKTQVGSSPRAATRRAA